jgi:glycosyltransferase involved in cell wall biosynthesis
MATVAHYLERWLEVSAGFVAAHVARSRHRGVVIARDGWVQPLGYDHRPRYSLAGLRGRAPQLSLLLAAKRVDVVHVHFGYPAADVLPVTRRRPYVLSLHGHDVTGLLAAEPDRYLPVTGAVDAVVVPSRFLAEHAVGAGFDVNRIAVIPSGVDLEFFTPAPPPAEPVVGFVGRLVPKKGIDTLASAWPAVVRAVPGARLVALGDGPCGRLLPDDDPTITVIQPDPSLGPAQARDVIRRAAVVVTPSHPGPDGDSESLLLVNLEAAACARPVVSTVHGGIPEYVASGRTGLLVPPADPAALAAEVIRLLRDADLARRLGATAREDVAQWDVRRCTRRVDGLYDDLLARRAARGRT